MFLVRRPISQPMRHILKYILKLNILILIILNLKMNLIIFIQSSADKRKSNFMFLVRRPISQPMRHILKYILKLNILILIILNLKMNLIIFIQSSADKSCSIAIFFFSFALPENSINVGTSDKQNAVSAFSIMEEYTGSGDAELAITASLIFFVD
jgi:hypothetical protein